MGTEIERKFLLQNDSWRSLAIGTEFRQGYLCSNKERTVRIRIKADKGFLTIKGASVGAARSEYEYEIPVEEAKEMLVELCDQPIIEKNRYAISYRGFTWEVDEFFGLNQGLIVAEIELEHEDQQFEKPDWIGREVTDDARYFNARLAKEPYATWPEKA